jgi:two-component system, NtrC family, sensor histidine kinase HydH
MRPYFTTILRVLFLLLLVLFSAALLFATAEYTHSARDLALQAIESTALALSSSAESALRKGGKKDGSEVRQILSDRVVAYALIARGDGKVLFHTNQRLVGSPLPGDEVSQLLQSKKASGRRITLGTGLPAYEFNYILYRPKGAPELLRLVLHTNPADRIVSRASRMWWAVGAVVLLLWATGFTLERVFARHLRLQAEMARKERLVLIGQMTAVLAHEIRNALGGIKGYTQWVHEKLTASDSAKEGLSMVLQGTDRIESLVNELLLFSRKETYQLKSFDLRGVIQEAIHSVNPTWRGDVTLEIEPEVRVIADKDKLLRVLVNGIQNAMHAMGSEGRLQIKGRKKGRWVGIRIEDTGPGIREEERSHLFTPFYTTKTDGTGLGLAYSLKVIEGMGGTIRLDNQEEGGAVLSIRLPRAGEE